MSDEQPIIPRSADQPAPQPVIAIVGANGFLGRALTRVAVDRGFDVIRVIRGPAHYEGPARSTPDLAAEPRLAALIEGADVCVNLAARVHVTRPGPEEDERAAHAAMNAEFPVRLAEAARAAGVRRFVQMSSVAAIASVTPAGVLLDDDSKPVPSSPYGRAKFSADLALAGMSSADFTTVSLRPPAIFGPGVGAHFARLMTAARRGIPLPVGAIDNARNFVFVDNVADAVLAAASHQASGAYIVTDSEALSTAALYRLLMSQAGRRPSTPHWPPFLIGRVARLLLGDRAESLIGNAAYDGSHFARTFGWRPPTQFEEAISRTVRASQAPEPAPL